MDAIARAIRDGGLEARIGIVLSDNPGALILRKAEEAGLRTGVMDCGGHRLKFPEAAQRTAVREMRAAGVELVCLAGFMRLVKRPLLEAFPRKILNIHPSLLPLHPGLEAWKQALDAGATETGVTVHIVDEGMDTGPVLAQERVRVHADDTPRTLHERIQMVEHRLYPKAIGEYAKKSRT